jgi:Arc/MetJ family transcription regulator
MARTTINIDKKIREELNKCKKYKRETYDEILQDLIREKILRKNVERRKGTKATATDQELMFGY